MVDYRLTREISVSKVKRRFCFILFITLSFFLLQLAVTLPLLYASSPHESPDTLPLWELRVAATAARLPHYIGSDEYKNYIFPLPYLIYRGEFFQADRDNMRTIFFKKGSFETDLSMWGNPPVPSSNRARTRMDELDALVEIGPAIRYYFQHDGRRDALYLKGAIRTAFSVGWESGPEIHYQGLHGSMHLVMKNESLFKDQGMRLSLSSGIHFADSTFNTYFYEVDMEDISQKRTFYAARGGYSGFSCSGSITRRVLPYLTFGCYARWDNINGATYDNSPLVGTENNYTIGTMLIFTVAKSKVSTSR
jgi:outer membrane protein